MAEWIVDIGDGNPHIKRMEELVRCGECKYASFSVYLGETDISCENTEGLFRNVPEDGYCYCGEKVEV